MPKFYCISDVHGFYDEMIEALDKAGFDKNNPNSYLITCGDHWDRGEYPVEVMHYLMQLDRWVGIRGNHEQLFEECCERGYWGSHDISNGTYDTICELGGAGLGRSFNECCLIAQTRAKPFFDKMVNYFETKNYVFCHSWIPVNCDDGLPMWNRSNRKFSKKEDWRFAHQSEWDQAMWPCSLKMAMNGLGADKTIVSGHWHCSYGHFVEAFGTDNPISEFDEDACFEPYYYKDQLIMIDGCTAHTGKVNVLVLEDEFV